MGVISFRVSDEMEIELKQQARIRGQKLTDFCKARVTEDLEKEELNRVTIESRIEQLGKQQRSMSINIYFQSRFLYHFAILAANNEVAANAWEAARKELKEME